VLESGRLRLLVSDISDWTITFVHTGLDSPIGERLRRVRRHVAGEEVFLANYADVLTDLPLNRMVEKFRRLDAVGALLAVPPQSAFHCVDVGGDDRVAGITTLQEMPLWENGGSFVLRPEIFDHLPPGGDLIADACAPLAKEGRLLAHPHRGFWQGPPTRRRSATPSKRPTGPGTCRGCSGSRSRPARRQGPIRSAPPSWA
jgi:glucose-1-phosphate cytidylyltransferase